MSEVEDDLSGDLKEDVIRLLQMEVKHLESLSGQKYYLVVTWRSIRCKIASWILRKYFHRRPIFKMHDIDIPYYLKEIYGHTKG